MTIYDCAASLLYFTTILAYLLPIAFTPIHFSVTIVRCIIAYRALTCYPLAHSFVLVRKNAWFAANVDLLPLPSNLNTDCSNVYRAHQK